ncbi:hypothetical protein BDZ45DRAFT_679470 [Acephala macrosclerotiorum]|nr:hypothetical protein BDZ45DRAFT_679470 [Acephala macrosclerotiorum]
MDPAEDTTEKIAESSSSIRAKKDDQRSFTYTKESRTTCATILKLFSRTCWTRLWIIQELVLSRQILVRIGNFDIDWDDLVPFFRRPPELIPGGKLIPSLYGIDCKELPPSRSFSREVTLTGRGVLVGSKQKLSTEASSTSFRLTKKQCVWTSGTRFLVYVV